MKKTTIPTIFILVLGLVVAVGSQTFLGACVHDDGSFGACHWACRAILGEGALLAVLSLMALVAKRARPGASQSFSLLAVKSFRTSSTTSFGRR